MYNDLLIKFDKKKAEKIKIFSLINHHTSYFFSNQNIDIFRFDIDEFAKLNNYKDKSRVSFNEIYPALKNIKLNNTLLAVDIPNIELFGDNGPSLDKINRFYSLSNADLLVLDFDFQIINVLKELSDTNIPVLINVKYNNGFKKEDNQLLQEIESYNPIMFLLEEFSEDMIKNLKKSISIPIVSDICSKNLCDGFYAKFSNIFGIYENDNKKYLNLSDLIKDGIDDYLNDN